MKSYQVYLQADDIGMASRESLTIYFRFYNGGRVHEDRKYPTPDEAYFAQLAAPIQVAA